VVAQLAVAKETVGRVRDQVGTALEPHALAMKTWAETTSATAMRQLEPATAAVSQWADSTGKQLAPVVAPVLTPIGKVVGAWTSAAQKQIALLAKQLEGPKAAFDAWCADTLRCLCLPFQPQVTYKGIAEDYPPPVWGQGAEAPPKP